MEEIIVTRSVPSVHILLQLDEIDPSTSGYQKPKAPSKFWLEPPQPPKQEQNRDNDYASKNNRRNFDKKTRTPKREANGEAGQSNESNSSKKGNNFRQRPKKVSILSENPNVEGSEGNK